MNETEKYKNYYTGCKAIFEYYGEEGYKTPQEIDLEEIIKVIFRTLIIANHKDIGAIQDTIWVNDFTTLWDYIRIVLNMDDNQFKEFEKQALNERIS